MTKPDEALLWAREQSVEFWEQSGAAPKDVAYHIAASRSGEYDGDLENIAHDRREWLDGYRAGAAASESRIKVLEEALAEADKPRWFYADEEASPCHSLEEAVEESIYEIEEFGNRLLVIPTARPGATIFGVVRILTEDEIQARGDQNPWTFTRCATEAEARALLKEDDQ